MYRNDDDYSYEEYEKVDKILSYQDFQKDSTVGSISKNHDYPLWMLLSWRGGMNV